MTASFNCPHCEATYPSLPTLYGRTVRCSTCKKPFRLRGDGTAEKVTVKVKADGTKRVERSEAEKEQLTKAFISKSKEAQKPATKRLKKRQESQKDISGLRKSMSTALSAAASEAIAGVERKQETTQPKTSSARKNGGNSQVMSAVLTNQGQREQKQFYTFIIAAIGILAVVVVCLVAFNPSTPETLALKAYVMPTGELRQPKKRAFVYLSRNWLTTYNGIKRPRIILDIDAANIEESVTYDLTLPCLVIQDSIVGLSSMPELAMWVDASKKEKINEIWGQHSNDPSPDKFYESLSKATIKFVPFDTVHKKILEKSDPFISFLLSTLLVGSTNERKGNKWAEKFLAGDTPTRCNVAQIHGTDGQEYIVSGNTGSYRQINTYHGTLVQIIGDQWDNEWRIFTLDETESIPLNPLKEMSSRFKNAMYERYDSIRNDRPRDN